MVKPNSFFSWVFSKPEKTYVQIAAEQKWLADFSSGEVNRPVGKNKSLVGYPDPACSEFKRITAKRFCVSKNMVAVGNGSDEIIENIPRVVLEPGESCLFVVPTFFRFIQSCQKMKARIITVATKEEDHFLVTPEITAAVKWKINRRLPKIIWIDSPNSVTGAAVPIDRIREIVSSTDQLAGVDEVHHELCDPENRQLAISLLPDHKNLIVIKSLSKAFCLAGVRLGFAITHPKIAEALERWRLTFTVNTVAQKLAAPVLLDKRLTQQTAASINKLRNKIFLSITKMPDFVIGAPSKTHLFIMKHKKIDLFEALKNRGILAADFRQAPGLEGLGYVRLNVKTPAKSRLLLKALSAIYNENSS